MKIEETKKEYTKILDKKEKELKVFEIKIKELNKDYKNYYKKENSQFIGKEEKLKEDIKLIKKKISYIFNNF